MDPRDQVVPAVNFGAMNEQMHESSEVDENLTWEVIDLPEMEDSSDRRLWRLLPLWLRGEAFDRQKWRRLGACGLVLLTLMAVLLIVPMRHVPAVSLTPLKASSGCHTLLAEAAAWSPSGASVASGRVDGTVQVWNARTGTCIFAFQQSAVQVRAVAWSPDGRRIASGGQTVDIWDALTGKHLDVYHVPDDPGIDTVQSLAWSPDGTYLASASLDETVQVWVAATGKYLFTAQQQAQPVTAVAWSLDGTQIAVAGFDVQVWDVPLGKQLYRFHSPALFPINTMTWLHDGRHIATVSIDDTVQTLQVT